MQLKFDMSQLYISKWYKVRGILKNPKLVGSRPVDYLQAQLTQRSYARDRDPQQIQLVRQRDHRILRRLSKQILLLLEPDNSIDLYFFAEDHLDWPPFRTKQIKY